MLICVWQDSCRQQWAWAGWNKKAGRGPKPRTLEWWTEQRLHGTWREWNGVYSRVMSLLRDEARGKKHTHEAARRWDIVHITFGKQLWTHPCSTNTNTNTNTVLHGDDLVVRHWSHSPLCICFAHGSRGSTELMGLQRVTRQKLSASHT